LIYNELTISFRRPWPVSWSVFSRPCRKKLPRPAPFAPRS